MRTHELWQAHIGGSATLLDVDPSTRAAALSYRLQDLQPSHATIASSHLPAQRSVDNICHPSSKARVSKTFFPKAKIASSWFLDSLYSTNSIRIDRMICAGRLESESP